MTINKSQFEKGLQDLRKVSMAPEEKGVLFKSLLNYAEKHPAPARVSALASLIRAMKGFLPAKSPIIK